MKITPGSHTTVGEGNKSRYERKEQEVFYARFISKTVKRLWSFNNPKSLPCMFSIVLVSYWLANVVLLSLTLIKICTWKYCPDFIKCHDQDLLVLVTLFQPIVQQYHSYKAGPLKTYSIAICVIAHSPLDDFIYYSAIAWIELISIHAICTWVSCHDSYSLELVNTSHCAGLVYTITIVKLTCHMAFGLWKCSLYWICK